MRPCIYGSHRSKTHRLKLYTVHWQCHRSKAHIYRSRWCAPLHHRHHLPLLHFIIDFYCLHWLVLYALYACACVCVRTMYNIFIRREGVDRWWRPKSNDVFAQIRWFSLYLVGIKKASHFWLVVPGIYVSSAISLENSESIACTNLASCTYKTYIYRVQRTLRKVQQQIIKKYRAPSTHCVVLVVCGHPATGFVDGKVFLARCRPKPWQRHSISRPDEALAGWYFNWNFDVSCLRCFCRNALSRPHAIRELVSVFTEFLIFRPIA